MSSAPELAPAITPMRRAVALAAGGWTAAFLRPVPATQLAVLRIVLFGAPAYLLASRYYEYAGAVPSAYFWERIGRDWFSQLVWFQPTPVALFWIQIAALIACVCGVLGVLVRQSALAASLGIVLLDNVQSTLTTSDAEVIPYALGLWTLIVLDPRCHMPVWRLMSRAEKTISNFKFQISNLKFEEAVPRFPFTLLQILLVTIYFANGCIKLPHWEQWVTQAGVLEHMRIWNELSPRLDSFWPQVRGLDLPLWCWQAAGAVTILFELTAPLMLVSRRLFWPYWLVLSGMHLLIWATMTTSFLLFPLLLWASFLPDRLSSDGALRPCCAS